MQSIDLSKSFPLAKMFGGTGELVTYADLQINSDVEPTGEQSLLINWSARGVGFGQAYLSDTAGEAETMSKSFVAAVLRRYVLDSVWSDEGYRLEPAEPLDDLLVQLANEEDRVGFRYTGRGVQGTVYLGASIHNHGEVSLIDVGASDIKTEAGVVALIFAWLEAIAAWN